MKPLFLLLTVLMTGCATMSNEQQQALIEELQATTPKCTEEKECQRKWDAAQVWVSNNAGYKIQTSSSAIIETYNSPARVTKTPIGNNQYQFDLFVGCGNWLLGCKTSKYDIFKSFNDTINAIK
jgi:hypothetical protein